MRAEEKLKEDGFEFVQEISSGVLIDRGYEWEEEDMTCRSWKLYAKAIGNITILKVADGTEINSVEDKRPATIDSDIIYNLGGQVVKNPSRGIYIKNGKKFIVE